MSRIQRIVALAAVGLLGAIGVTGVMAGPGGVLGGGSSDDSPAAAQSGDVQTPDSLVAESGDTPDGETEVVGDADDCPAGEDTQFKFEQSASEFEVTGTLVSFDGTTVVVTGPTGDVTAAVDTDADIKGDLSADGTPVKVEGAVLDGGSLVAREIKPACEPEDDVNDDQGDDEDDADEQEVVGDVIDCPAGEDTQFKFEQSASEFEVTGLLVSLTATEVQVTGPDGVPGGNPVIAAVDPNAEVKGDLSAAGTPVKVEGSILDGAFVAHEIEPACEDEDDFDDDVDEGDDANDDSSSGGDEESGDDHGGHGEDEGDGENSGHDGGDDNSGHGSDDGEEDEG